MEYIELPEANPGGDGLCSDNECPCGYPGAKIPRGSGYIYISDTVVDFRRDALTVQEAKAKIGRLQQHLGGGMMTFSQNILAPILMCERGAKKRGLDLEVAAADARHWWKTGLVPLRATPLAGSAAASKEKASPESERPARPADSLASAVARNKEQIERGRQPGFTSGAETSQPTSAGPAFPDKMDRPGCVTAYAILLGLGGLGIGLGGTVFSVTLEAGFVGSIGFWIIAGLYFLLARGLWLLRNWARIIVMILAGLGVLGGLISICGSLFSPFAEDIISALISGVVIMAINGTILYWFADNDMYFG